MTRITPLNGQWMLSAIDPEPNSPAAHLPSEIAATVPGTVHTDLLSAGLIEDPYIGLTEPESAWIGHTRWSYRRSLLFAPEGHARADLVFDGLDTIATVVLNGVEVGRTFNQHRTYRFDVSELLHSGENELEVRFDSAWEYAKSVEADLGPLPNAYPTPFNFIRKMAANFGWDWGPQLVTAGIWREVRLEQWSDARLASVRPATRFDEMAHLFLEVDLERVTGGRLQLIVDVADTSRTVEVPAGTNRATLELDLPDLAAWWPRGMGEQPLYDLKVALVSEGEPVQEWSRRIGFRTATLDTSPDEAGSAFTIAINGVPLFIRGANWIPDDCFPSRITRERYRQRIDQATGANLNLLRVWGGGIYESDDFYELCDELGVLVWQDFLFACAAYPEESPVREEVEAEARDNVSRLMAHPSLILWNGCNENIWGWFDWGWQEPIGDRTWGLGYYLELLPEIVAELDPVTPYWPGSPFSGSVEIHANDPAHSNVHIWDVWNQKDYTVYGHYSPRFVSEFGFQGPPTWATLTRALTDDPLTPESPGMLLHQKAEDGNGKLARGMEPHLPEPRDFTDWHYLTQLNQARAIQYAIERYRSLRGHCMGTIVWQLNDCWPVTSWAAVDGDGLRKPLWHSLRDASADRLLTLQGEGSDTRLVAVNDSLIEWRTTVDLELYDFDGTKLPGLSHDLIVAPLSVTELHLPDELASPSGSFRVVLVARAQGALATTKLFAEDRDLEFSDPEIELKLGAWSNGVQHARLTAKSFARSVGLFLDRLHPEAWSERMNVDLIPGVPVEFEVYTPVPLDEGSILVHPVLQCVNEVAMAPRGARLHAQSAEG